MTSPQFEQILARLYADERYRRRFLRDPAAVLAETSLCVAERAALMDIDRVGLEVAATSYAAKRCRHRTPTRSA